MSSDGEPGMSGSGERKPLLRWRYVVLMSLLIPVIFWVLGSTGAGDGQESMLTLGLGIGALACVMDLLVWQFRGDHLRKQGWEW